MNDATDLGRLIRETRLKKGMSLSQLAAEVGRSSSSVRRWERGEVPPAKAVVPALATALDITEDKLDELRPTGADVVESGDEPAEPGSPNGGPSTLEQPVVDAPIDEPFSIDDSVPSEDRASRSGLLAELRDAWRALTKDWTGWIRGLATAGVLLLLLLILVWAVGELFNALGEIWDSFDASTD